MADTTTPPQTDPLEGQHDSVSETGKAVVRKRVEGRLANVAKGHLMRKKCSLVQVQITPKNLRNDYFQSGGFMDVEIPGNVVDIPDNAFLWIRLSNTDTTSTNDITMNNVWTWFTRIEIMPEGGDTTNTFYSRDIREWLQLVDDTELTVYSTVCGFQDKFETRPLSPGAMLELGAVGHASKSNQTVIHLPLKIPELFMGHTYWRALKSRPVIRFYWRSDDGAVYAKNGSTLDDVRVEDVQLLITGPRFYGSATKKLKDMYKSNYVWQGCSPQRMLLNFTTSTSGTPANRADPSSYQTTTALYGLYAYLTYYLILPANDSTAGTFDENYYGIDEITWRSSNGDVIGYERQTSSIRLSEQRRFNTSYFSLQRIKQNTSSSGNIQQPTVIPEPFGVDIMKVKKWGWNEGGRYFDGQDTLQISIGLKPDGTSITTTTNLQLHLHGQRYTTFAQSSDGRIKVKKR